ncbi:MAG: hypothetical protein U0822_04180 [Anaerolineae bacterium]
MADQASSTTVPTPNPADPDNFLEPLVFSVPGAWPWTIDAHAQGITPPKSPLAPVAAQLAALHAGVLTQAAATPTAKAQGSDLIEGIQTRWKTAAADLGPEMAWLDGARPEGDLGALPWSDLAVLTGQLVAAVQIRMLGKKLSDLDHLRAYTAQMRADWEPIGRAVPSEPLQPGVAVSRYNYLLTRARATVVKQSQHVANLDDINLDEMKRTYIVLHYSLIQLVRSLSFA